MEGFIDIHTHILPGVDDGAEDISEAMRMLRIARDNGTRALVLTPHWRNDSSQSNLSRNTELFGSFCRQALTEFPELELYLGSEVSYGSTVPEKLEAGEIQTLNGSHYVLLEFSSGCLRSRMLNGISACVYSGFTPVIAHVERYDVMYHDASFVDEVLDMGALIQINAQSILGMQGLRPRAFCHRLLRREQVHFVASDCHHADRRTPLLHKCWEKVSKKYGEDYALRIFRENARKVIQDMDI